MWRKEEGKEEGGGSVEEGGGSVEEGRFPFKELTVSVSSSESYNPPPPLASSVRSNGGTYASVFVHVRAHVCIVWVKWMYMYKFVQLCVLMCCACEYTCTCMNN